MNFPESYEDIKDKIEETLISFNVEDIIYALSIITPLGVILPEEHIKILDLENFIKYILDKKDINLLQELHNTLEFYFNNKIQEFMNVSKYSKNMKHNKDYLWAEKTYYEMFGIWSPRMIYLNYSKMIKGNKLYVMNNNFNKYVYCELEENEIDVEKCINCPFRGQNYYCKYKEIIDG